MPAGQNAASIDTVQIQLTCDLAFPRRAVANLDEIHLLVSLIRPQAITGGLMVDIGAHRGGSLAPFWEAGWTVVAFEPDPRHHQALSTAIQGIDRVLLDGQAVS